MDPWQRAAECVRALEGTNDPDQRLTLTHLKRIWITLGNEQTFMTKAELAEEVRAIDWLHLQFVGPDRGRLKLN